MALTLDKPAHNPRGEATSGAALAQSAEVAGSQETVAVETTRFGQVEVEQDLIMTFPNGVIGFETQTRYAVISQNGGGSLRWLQSLDSPALAFPIVEPWEVRPDYSATISDADTQALGICDEAPALVFSIVTVPPHNPQEMTINLLAPLIVNVVTRFGKQVIVQEQEYTTRHRVVDELQRGKSARIEMSTGGMKAA